MRHQTLHIVFLVILMGLGPLGPSLVLADDSAVDEGPPLRIAIMDLPPYSYLDKNKVRRGILVEVAEAILEKTGLPGSVSTVPTERLFRSLRETKEYDCTMTAMDDGPFSRDFTKIVPLDWQLAFGFVPRIDVKLTKYEDLENIRIGVARGILLNDEFDGDASLHKIPTKGYDASMRMLDRGRIDAAAGVITSLLFGAREAELPSTSFGKPMVLVSKEVWFYCEPGSKILEKHKDRIKKAVESLSKSGWISKTIRRYE